LRGCHAESKSLGLQIPLGSRVALSRTTAEDSVEDGQYEQSQDVVRENASNDHGGKWTLDFRPDTGIECHGNETEGGNAGRHEDGAEALTGGLDDSALAILPRVQAIPDPSDEHQSIEHGNAADSHEPDSGRDREGHSPCEQGSNPTESREWGACEDQEGVSSGTGAGAQEKQDQNECQGNDESQAMPGPMEMLKLAPVLQVVAEWKVEMSLQHALYIADESIKVDSRYISLYEDSPFLPFTLD